MGWFHFVPVTFKSFSERRNVIWLFFFSFQIITFVFCNWYWLSSVMFSSDLKPTLTVPGMTSICNYQFYCYNTSISTVDLFHNYFKICLFIVICRQFLFLFVFTVERNALFIFTYILLCDDKFDRVFFSAISTQMSTM